MREGIRESWFTESELIALDVVTNDLIGEMGRSGRIWQPIKLGPDVTRDDAAIIQRLCCPVASFRR